MPIMAFVDPDLRKLIAPNLWSWKPADDGAQCAATTCEIDLLPPADAFKAIRRLLPNTKPYAFITMLALQRGDASEFLASTSEARIVVLPRLATPGTRGE